MIWRCRSQRVLAVALLLAGLIGAHALAGADGVSAEGVLTIPRGSDTQLRARESLPVTALFGPAGRPVPANEILVEVDAGRLERELAATRERMLHARDERRRVTTQQEVVRGGTAGGQAEGSSWDLQNAATEADAARDLMALQTRVSTASLRAPADGYVVRYLLEVGDSTRRRKAAVVFVEARKTLVVVGLPVEAARPLTDAVEVRVASTGEPERSFRARLERTVREADTVELQLRPLELPFLEPDTRTPITLSVAR